LRMAHRSVTKLYCPHCRSIRCSIGVARASGQLACSTRLAISSASAFAARTPTAPSAGCTTPKMTARSTGVLQLGARVCSIHCSPCPECLWVHEELLRCSWGSIGLHGHTLALPACCQSHMLTGGAAMLAGPQYSPTTPRPTAPPLAPCCLHCVWARACRLHPATSPQGPGGLSCSRSQRASTSPWSGRRRRTSEGVSTPRWCRTLCRARSTRSSSVTPMKSCPSTTAGAGPNPRHACCA
jgi:hypothetical protein